MCDVERGIVLVGVSEEPILMSSMTPLWSAYIKQDTRFSFIIFILPIDVIVEYMTDLQYRNSLLLQNAHQIYSV